MGRTKHTPEQVIGKLREAEVLLAQGVTVSQVSRQLGVTDQGLVKRRSQVLPASSVSIQWKLKPEKDMLLKIRRFAQLTAQQ